MFRVDISIYDLYYALNIVKLNEEDLQSLSNVGLA